MTITHDDEDPNRVVFETRKTGYVVRGEGVEALRFVVPTLVPSGKGKHAWVFVEPYQFGPWQEALERNGYHVAVV